MRGPGKMKEAAVDSDAFEARMRALEYFHNLRMLPGTWPVLRVDGKGFAKLTEARFAKPFDLRFSECMVAAAEALLTRLGGLYAYTESDEISVLLPRDWDLYDREVEKAVSIAAGLASAQFTLASGVAAAFDARVWLGATHELVVDYFRWRQADAARCALNGWAYWTLRQAGHGVREATAGLLGKSVGEKNEMLFQRGVNFNEVPAWQRRGVGLFWEEYEKAGFDPVRQQEVKTLRRRISVDRKLPMKAEYVRYIARILSGVAPAGVDSPP
jgi:tRNA(His) guanylyltransferase